MSYFLNPNDYNSEEILKEDNKYVLSVGLKKRNIVITSGRGCKIKDLNGKEYLDFNSSVFNVSVGHGNFEIIDTMKKQIDLLCHSHFTSTNIPKVKSAELIVNLFPQEARMRKFYTISGGSEANETMLKLARKYKEGATKFISWWESYHGATMGALSVSGQKISKPFYLYPFSFDVEHVPMPNCNSCEFGKSYPKCGIQCAKFVKELVSVIGGDKFAGMIFEPIVSAVGGLVPPKEYFEVIKEICDKEKIALMFDEVVTGFGKTGKMFGCEHFNIYPKMMSFGKSLTSGYFAASGTVIDEDIAEMGGFDGNYHGFTSTGNILGNAVIYANIKYIIDNNLIDNAANMGVYLQEQLSSLINKYSNIVTEIRGKGLIQSIVFNRNISMEKVQIVIDKALELGLLLYASSRSRGNLIMLTPPLIINKDEIDFAVDTIFKSFENIF